MLLHHIGPLIFAHRRESCPYANPPNEMFMRVDFDDLWKQYERLNRLVRTILGRAEGTRVTELVAVGVFFVVVCAVA